MGNIKIAHGYGQARIKIGSTYYSFDILKGIIDPSEVWDKGFINKLGKRINEVIGYWIDFDFILCTLVPHTGYSITKDQTHMNNFINAYYALSGSSKEIYFIPFASEDATFEEANNVTIFKVILKVAPKIETFKIDRTLGQRMIFKAELVQMIDVDDGIQIPYMTTSDGLWHNLPSEQIANVKDGGSLETLQFKNSGSLIDAEFRSN